MQVELSASRIVLEPGHFLCLDDAKGVHIRPRGARIWVTQEGDTSDFVVDSGEDFVVSRAGRTVVQAIGATAVELHEANA